MKIMIWTMMLLSTTIGANAVKNGNFEQWDNGKPASWQINDGSYEPETLFKVSGQNSLRMKTSVMQKAQWLNNTIKQQFKLAPDTAYELEICVAKESTGTLQFDLYPMTDGKKGKSIAGYSRWTWGFPFNTLKREFTTAKDEDFLLEIRHFGAADAFCYLDRVSITPKATAAPEPGIYTLSSMFHCDGAIPAVARPLDSLDFVACRNETESRLVLWKAPADQSDVALRVKSSSGLSVVIRDLIDSVLPVSKPRAVKSGDTLAWQVFVQTTPELAVGDYAAELELTINGKSVKNIPLKLKIVDITLPPADISFLVYHSESYMPERFLTPELRELYYRDMSEHGMNTITLYNNPQNGNDIDFTRNYSHELKLIPEKYRNRDDKSDPDDRYNPLAWQKIFDFGLTAQMELAAKYGLIGKKYPILWLPTKLGTYGFGGMPATPLKKALEKWRANPDWPEPLLYVMDEPYDLPDRIAGALRIFKNLEDNQIDVRTVTAHPHPDILGQYYDVWILSTTQSNPVNLKKALAMNRQIWCYNCVVPNTNAAFFRAMYGFWALQNQLTGVATWAYYDARGKFVEAPDGSLSDKSNRLSRVGLSAAGPVPTAAWEATREGVEDYRLAQYYLDLMGRLAAARDKYQKEAAVVLSSHDQQAIRRREEAKGRKFDPAAAPVAWEADTAEKTAAEELFLKFLELDKVYRCARQGNILLESVGSLAPAGRNSDDLRLRTWHPDLGENNAPDDAEVKRNILLPYVIMLQQAVGDNP